MACRESGCGAGKRIDPSAAGGRAEEASETRSGYQTNFLVLKQSSLSAYSTVV